MSSTENVLWELIHGTQEIWTWEALTDRTVRRLVYHPVDWAMEQVLDRIEIRIDVNSMGYAKCSQLKSEM